MAVTTLKFITIGASTWTVPSDIDASTVVTVIAIGGGGGGKAGGITTAPFGGGGGGAFSLTTISGLSPGSTAYMSIGTQGGTTGGDSWFNKAANSAPTINTNGVLAKGGSAATTIASAGGAGGAAASGIGTTTFSGGAGGAATGAGISSGGGGGGSAGSSLGNGFAGGAAVVTSKGGGGGGAGVRSAGASNSTTTGGNGGTGFPSNAGGVGGAAGIAGGVGLTGAGGGGGGGGPANSDAAIGGTGGVGAEYTVTAGGTAGSGGGGGGGGGNAAAINSGLFAGDGAGGGRGGGGGGSGGSVNTTGNSNGAAGFGGAGLIIIQYTPVATDTTPDAFTFVDQTNVAISTTITSAAITVAGINAASAISITNGTYSINGGAYTSTAGTVVLGNTVTVRHTSSASFSTATNTTLTIGGVSDIFTSTTTASDSTPDAFTFVDQVPVALNTLITSAAITVAGINTASAISITGGTYSINGGAYTSTAGTVTLGNTVTVQHTSSSIAGTATNTILTIGGVSDTFTSTTIDTIPDAFTFVDQTNVALSTVITSAAITVTGINSASAISITGGTYSINGGAYTSTAGTVVSGNSITVQHTSSASFSTATNTTLTIGGISDIFTSTTLAIDTTPTQFTFVDQTNVALNSTIISAAITVAGINSPATISITGGSYSINSGGYTNVAGTVSLGDSVTVSHTSSPSNSATTDTTLNIGGVTDIFTSTTVAAGATYNVVPTSSSVNEGSSLVFNVTTSGVADTTLYWTISPASDVSATNGSFALTSNTGSFTLTATADSTTEGLETFTVSVRTGSITGTIVTSTVFSINDTSTGVAGNNRVVLGKLGDGTTYGLEVSKLGYDVLTTGVENIIFSSKWGAAGNILMQGFNTVSYTNTGAGIYGSASFTVTFPSTLPYNPVVFACLTDSTNTTIYAFNSYNIFLFTGFGTGGSQEFTIPQVAVSSTTTSAQIKVGRLVSGQTLGVRYYVLAVSGG